MAVIPVERPITNVNPLNHEIHFDFPLVGDGNVSSLTALIPVRAFHY